MNTNESSDLFKRTLPGQEPIEWPFRTFQIDDGFGGTIELIQFPGRPQPETPYCADLLLVPYDQL